MTETAQLHDELLEINEALVLGSLRQHELTEAANSLNIQLQTEIAERKRVEEALRESEDRYRNLFAAVPIAVFVCDRNAVIQHCNRRAVELLGQDLVSGVGQHCGSLTLCLPDGTLLPRGQNPIMDVLRTGTPALNVEVLIERPDGSRLPVLVKSVALKDAVGDITGAINSLVDITERKQADERQRLLTYELAHRGNNLLAVVQAIASQSLSGTRSLAEARDVLMHRLHASFWGWNLCAPRPLSSTRPGARGHFGEKSPSASPVWGGVIFFHANMQGSSYYADEFDCGRSHFDYLRDPYRGRQSKRHQCLQSSW